MARDSNICITPIIYNGGQQDILIAIRLTLGVQRLSNDINSQLFGATIQEVDLIDTCVSSKIIFGGHDMWLDMIA